MLLPTNPTILEDTVAKKNPNIIINMAPRGFMVIPGIKHMATAITKIPVKINHIGKSLAVLSPPDTFLPKPFMAWPEGFYHGRKCFNQTYNASCCHWAPGSYTLT